MFRELGRVRAQTVCDGPPCDSCDSGRGDPDLDVQRPRRELLRGGENKDVDVGDR